jgi:hypothetical protein
MPEFYAGRVGWVMTDRANAALSPYWNFPERQKQANSDTKLRRRAQNGKSAKPVCVGRAGGLAAIFLLLRQAFMLRLRSLVI